MSSTQDKLIGIQYLRALSALAVILFHVSETYHFNFIIGQIGVDVFFVISGFVMWLTTANRDANWKSFLIHRLRRLIPTYWIVTIVIALVASLKPNLFWGVHVSPENIFKSLFFIPYEAAPGQRWPVVIQGWTLNLEMFFYAIFALSLLLRQQQRLIAITLILLILPVLGLLVPHQLVVLAVWTSPHLLEFAAGVWLGYLYASSKLTSRLAGLTLLAFAIGAMSLIHSYAYQVNEYRVLLYGLPAAALVAGVLLVENTVGIVRIGWLRLLGDASYSMYLWSSLLIFHAVFEKLRLELPMPVEAALVFFLNLPFLLAAYWLFEKPVERYLRLKLK